MAPSGQGRSSTHLVGAGGPGPDGVQVDLDPHPVTLPVEIAPARVDEQARPIADHPPGCAYQLLVPLPGDPPNEPPPELERRGSAGRDPTLGFRSIRSTGHVKSVEWYGVTHST